MSCRVLSSFFLSAKQAVGDSREKQQDDNDDGQDDLQIVRRLPPIFPFQTAVGRICRAITMGFIYSGPAIDLAIAPQKEILFAFVVAFKAVYFHAVPRVHWAEAVAKSRPHVSIIRTVGLEVIVANVFRFRQTTVPRIATSEFLLRARGKIFAVVGTHRENAL